MMQDRILLIACALLLSAVSCRNGTGSPQQGPPKHAPKTLPARRETALLLDRDGFSRPFGFIRCGLDSFPICDSRLVSGFASPEPWGFWTEGQQTEMQIGIPWFLLGKKIVVDFMNVSYAFSARQQNLSFEFTVRGKTVLRTKLDRKSPRRIKLVIPAGLNQSPRLDLTIRSLTALQKFPERNPKEKSRKFRTPGIGFYYLKPKDLPKNRLTRGIFEITKIVAPDKNGGQLAELRCIDHFQGPLPSVLKTVLQTRAIPPDDPVRHFDCGERLELILDTHAPFPRVLFGRAAAKDDFDRPDDPAEITSPYLPNRLPENPVLPDAVRRAQQKQIDGDLPRIRRTIKSIRKINALDERFQRDWIRRQKKLEVIPRIFSLETGQEIERFQNCYHWKMLGECCFALPKDYNFVGRTGIEHNIVALHALHQLLRSCNVQLIVVLIPDAGQIAARVMVPEFARIGDLTALQCAATMLEYGIEAIYADDVVSADTPRSERLFCYPDPTPEAGLWKILADLTARRLERFGDQAFREKTPSHFSERRAKTIFGDHYRWPEEVECGEHKNGETVESLEVFRNGVPFRPDPGSGILVIGGETLDRPGPGYSFSGQLSMRLKYPVDELTLPGEVWFQDLPSVLCREPDRFLRGKKVCLLMLSPRMLTGSVFPDLQKESALYAGRRGKKAVHRFPIQKAEPDFDLPEPVEGERLYRQKQRWNRQWKQFSLTDPPTASFRIEDGSREQLWTSFELPEKLQSDRPSVLVLEAAVYPLQAVTVTVNGRKVPLRINTGDPHFRFCAAELPPHTKKIEIKISGRQDNRVMFRNVLLYQ